MQWLWKAPIPGQAIPSGHVQSRNKLRNTFFSQVHMGSEPGNELRNIWRMYDISLRKWTGNNIKRDTYIYM